VADPGEGPGRPEETPPLPPSLISRSGFGTATGMQSPDRTEG